MASILRDSTSNKLSMVQMSGKPTGRRCQLHACCSSAAVPTTAQSAQKGATTPGLHNPLNLTLKLTADWVPAGVALTGFLLQQRSPSHLTPHFVEAVHELVKATSSSPELLDQVCNLTKPFGCLPSP